MSLTIVFNKCIIYAVVNFNIFFKCFEGIMPYLKVSESRRLVRADAEE